MTEPIDQEAPDLISTGTQETVIRAKQLGLTWTMRLATVVSVESNFLNITAILDGDQNNTPLTMTNMIGFILPGQRVYTIMVPPGGNFVVGKVPTVNAGNAYIWSNKLTASVASVSTLTISDIPAGVISLHVEWSGRDTAAVAAAATAMQIDGDSGLVYGHRFIQGAGLTASALTHTQSFGALTSAIVGAHPGSSATAGRFASGHVIFPAWNAPNANFLVWQFAGGFETAVNSGFYLTGDGVYGGGSPYTQVSIIPQTAFDVGSQIIAWGVVVPE